MQDRLDSATGRKDHLLREKILGEYQARKKEIDKLLDDESLYKYIFLPSGTCFWVILGKTSVYFLLPYYYCSCRDYYFNVILRKKEVACYHMVALVVGEMKGSYKKIGKVDDVYENYLEDFYRLL